MDATKKRPVGTLTAGGTLDRIIQAKAVRLAEAKNAAPLEQLIARCEAVAASRSRRSLAESLLVSGKVNIIAEIKRRSPSKGIIRDDFDPVRLARSYVSGGAAAISVLAEEDFFDGSLDHLKEVRPVVDVPVLRKDFIFDEYQLYEAVAAGADAVLLIVAALDDDLLARLTAKACDLQLDALVEAHTAEELGRASQAGAQIIGVNNRNLTTFEVDLDTSFRLARLAPPNSILVSESGIKSSGDVLKLKQAGFRGFLIGEHFMRAEEPELALREMIAGVEVSARADGFVS